MVFITEFKALEITTGKLKTYEGPRIEALSFSDAEYQCKNTAPYLEVMGILEAEIPCKPGTFDPDYDNEIRYDNLN